MSDFKNGEACTLWRLAFYDFAQLVWCHYGVTDKGKSHDEITTDGRAC